MGTWERVKEGDFDSVSSGMVRLGTGCTQEELMVWGEWEQENILDSVLDYVVFKVLVGYLVKRFSSLEHS